MYDRLTSRFTYHLPIHEIPHEVIMQLTVIVEKIDEHALIIDEGTRDERVREVVICHRIPVYAKQIIDI